MISDFKDDTTARIFAGEVPKKFERIARVAQRKLLMIDAAYVLKDLNAPPGNRLEQLQGNRSAYHSIRVNDQWRVCFIWKDGNAHSVVLEDYHS